MIRESKTGRKVPAISTSEDSNELEQSSPTLPELCTSVTQNESTKHASAKESDESRDMGDTERLVAHKQRMESDEKIASLSNNQDMASMSSSAVASSKVKGADVDPRQWSQSGYFGMASAGNKEDRVRQKEPSQLRLQTASADRKDEAKEMDAPSAIYGATESSHSLLPSPSTSFDPFVDGPQWRNSHYGSAAGSTEKQTLNPRHRPSPATTHFNLPGQKPVSGKPEHGDEEASFNLFGQSFDTISDTGTYFRDLHHTEPTAVRGDGLSPSFSMLGLHQRRPDVSQQHSMDISLPLLGQYAGDISPIRVYGENEDHGRSMEPIPVHFPQDDEAGDHGFHRSMSYSDQVASAANAYSRNVPSNPFFVLRCARQAFSRCTFLLSCLRTSDPCKVNVGGHGSFHLNQDSGNQTYHEPLDPQIQKLASRRVGAAICAFGGYVEPELTSRKNSSIFRPKGDLSGAETRGNANPKDAYDERLRSRYFQSGGHLSWEVEENPPVMSSDSNQARENILAHMNTGSESSTQKDARANVTEASPRSPSNKQSSSQSMSPYSSIVEMTSSNGSDPPKMKYRCKLCGQPKQNHSCPYQQSMLRSIGVSVHPAVNSFTAHEPGALAPALSEMNNFVSYDSDRTLAESLKATSVAAGKQRRTHASVTPETFRPGVLLSPQSSLSTRTPSPETTPPPNSRDKSGSGETDGSQRNDTRKRSHSEMETDLTVSHDTSVPFIEEISLRPEQYRAVTLSKNPAPVGAYQYPTIPLTFMERQKLSDTLFVLSRQIPQITEECASILQEARKEEKWDLAIAELLTQLVVALYCQEGDRYLDGLQHYLLYLGISA